MEARLEFYSSYYTLPAGEEELYRYFFRYALSLLYLCTKRYVKHNIHIKSYYYIIIVSQTDEKEGSGRLMWVVYS